MRDIILSQVAQTLGIPLVSQKSRGTQNVHVHTHVCIILYAMHAWLHGMADKL